MVEIKYYYEVVLYVSSPEDLDKEEIWFRQVVFNFSTKQELNEFVKFCENNKQYKIYDITPIRIHTVPVAIAASKFEETLEKHFIYKKGWAIPFDEKTKHD